jgi:hypothetical protein
MCWNNLQLGLQWCSVQLIIQITPVRFFDSIIHSVDCLQLIMQPVSVLIQDLAVVLWWRHTVWIGNILDLLLSFLDIVTLILTTVPKHRTVSISAVVRTNVALNKSPSRRHFLTTWLQDSSEFWQLGWYALNMRKNRYQKILIYGSCFQISFDQSYKTLLSLLNEPSSCYLLRLSFVVLLHHFHSLVRQHLTHHQVLLAFHHHQGTVQKILSNSVGLETHQVGVAIQVWVFISRRCKD